MKPRHFTGNNENRSNFALALNRYKRETTIITERTDIVDCSEVSICSSFGDISLSDRLLSLKRLLLLKRFA